MSLQPGTRLGPYEVAAKIGEGGMGEVYRARDMALNRDVAIKVLPEALASDTDRLARFQREAEALAALNHPNIATVHGLETSGSVRALVMELVDGEDLSLRIARGPLPLDDALPIARQITEALEAAHERGIIHRDLKPANIKVKEDGTVKVLDFGLAKALDPKPGTAAANELANSPTMTSPAMTQIGMILGTAGYMSPEQARGQPTDTRADVWAFGCVLYEMLSGQQIWSGGTATDVIAALVARDPDWSRLPANLSPRLRFLLERCLEKEARDRCQSIGEVRADIEKAIADPDGAQLGPAVSDGRTGSRSRLVWALVTAGIAAAAAAAVWLSTRPEPPLPVRLMAGHPGPEFVGGNHFNANIALSPDGRRIAYVATASENNQNEMPLYARALDELEPTLLSESARAPFFSPDGEWVGFVEANGPLMRVAFTGGPAVRIGGNANGTRGATWGPDDTIVYAGGGTLFGGGLQRISVADESEADALTTPDQAQGETRHLFPEFLPGGRSLLFTIEYAAGAAQESQIAVLDLDSGNHKVLIPGGSSARYASSGHIVYGVDGTLRAVPFDLDRLEVLGTPVPVLDGIVTRVSGAASFGLSTTGTLVYVAGEHEEGARTRPTTTISAMGLEGTVRPLTEEPRVYGNARVSPDGSRLAVEVLQATGDAETSHIWVIDYGTGIGTQLTFEGTRNVNPVWTRDGQTVVFVSGGEGVETGIYRKAADGSGEAQLLYAGERLSVTDTLEGGTLIFHEGSQETRSADIKTLDIEGDGSASEFLATSADERLAKFSPDGRWITYVSDETGQAEVYARPYPASPGGQRRISNGGGFGPLWSPKGDRLYFGQNRASGLMLMAVPVQTASGFVVERSLELFPIPDVLPDDISPDGREFILTLISSAAESDGEETLRTPPELIVVQNWFEELKQLVPVR